MKPSSLLVEFVLLFTITVSLAAEQKPISKITVMGTVFCDTCSNATFSNHSYFLAGVEVQVNCKYRAKSSRGEQASFSINRTTDRYGIYRFDIPSFDGFQCREGRVIGSMCRARAVRSSSSSCNSPGHKTTTANIAVKFKQSHVCVYSLNALTYRPSKKDLTLCGPYNEERPPKSLNLNSSEFFLPFVPPFDFPFPPWPTLPWPPWPFSPNFPPFPSLPFPFPPIPFLPRPPAFPFPFPPIPFLPSPPAFPFPFPPIPFLPSPPAFPFPFPPIPFLPSPPPAFPFPFPPIPFLPSPPPAFPFPFPPVPSLFPPPPPPPPAFPFPFPPIPYLFPPPPPPPPPPPAFSWIDPRTWYPFYPPSPPANLQNQHP